MLAEESGSREGSTNVRWIVDPLDGTVNYYYGIPAYGVSIAAEVDGVVVAGAVYSALHRVVFDAVLGGGARVSGSAAGLLIAAEAGARTGTVDSPDGQVVVASAPGVYQALVAELERLYTLEST